MKKYAPYILILVILFVGLFGPLRKVDAASESCTFGNGTQGVWVPNSTDPNRRCQAATQGVGTTQPPATGIGGVGSAPDPNKSEFQKYVDKYGCGLTGYNSLLPGCLISGSYYLFYALPALILWLAAYFFNVLISITLSSKMFLAPFVGSAWGVVRDLSNIFFILILLYIAIKIILGLGGSDVKKMIAKVVIIALLINFSMFFTQVVIDTSNILALIFYNKLDTCNKDTTTGKCRIYSTVTGEKDVAGNMVNAFDPTQLLTKGFFETAGTIDPGITGVQPQPAPVSASMLIGITIMAGLIMFFAAYALFVAGISFLGRLIELLVLIIFSPFAFMSFTVPKLASYEYIGWDAWFKRLIATSFMAPIFMFFMFFMFMLINVKPNIFQSLVTQTGEGMLIRILSVIIPAGLILMLLLRATDFAKKGGGKLGEMLMKGAKMAGGLALGAGVGVAAVAGRATLGRAGAALAGSERVKKWTAGRFGGEAAMTAFKKIGSGSFDVRGAKIGGQTLASATGMKLGEAQKGGFSERRAQDIRKRQERAKDIEVGEDEYLKQQLNATEMNLQQLLSKNAQDIETLDKGIEKTRQDAVDANSKLNAASAKLNAVKGTGTTTNGVYEPSQKEKDALAELEGASEAHAVANKAVEDAKTNKKNFREGKEYEIKNSKGETEKKTVKDESGNIINIDNLEKVKKEQAQEIKTENVNRKVAYATKLKGGGNRAWNFVTSGGQYALRRGANEAAHKIITEVKLDSGTKT